MYNYFRVEGKDRRNKTKFFIFKGKNCYEGEKIARNLLGMKGCLVIGKLDNGDLKKFPYNLSYEKEAQNV